jgi:hypothetical protein
MTDGPAAGLGILDSLALRPELARWPQLHTARAGLLRELGRVEDAVAAYRRALALVPPPAEQRFIHHRITGLTQSAGARQSDDPTATRRRNAMVDVDAALQTQIRNIEQTYGHPLAHWFTVIDASGLSKHTEVVAFLKSEHGLKHGAAHRLSLLARDRTTSSTDHSQPHSGPAPATPEQDTDPVAVAVDALYAGRKAGLRPLHDQLMETINSLGDLTVSPKKGYLSLRRRKQFAMIQPSTATRIDLGLILPPDAAASSRLESAATWNALFTHRVRISSTDDLDPELHQWLQQAYTAAQ